MKGLNYLINSNKFCKFEIIIFHLKKGVDMFDFKLFRITFLVMFIIIMCNNIPVHAYNIKGKVINTKGEPIQSTVLMKTDLYSDYISVNTVDGNFEFSSSEARFLFAIPNDSIYIPGYYQEGENSTIEFQYATKLNNDNSENIVIILDTIIPIQGPCKITGSIDAEEYPVNPKKEDETQLGRDSVYVYLYTFDSENRIRKFIRQTHDIWNDYSDPKEYIIDNLDSGKYKLVIDALNMNNYYEKKQYDTIKFALTLEQPVFNFDFQLLTGGKVTESENIRQIEFYPNPIERYLNLTFKSKYYNSIIIIYDIIGTEVFRKEFISETKDNYCRFDLISLQSGAYFLKIISKDEVATVPFLIRR